MALAWLVALSRPALADDAAVPDDVPHGHLKFRVLAGADGLGNLVIYSIAQDANGFLWLATEDGVYRFDGDRLTHFTVADGLPSSLVFVVGVAPDGEVYAGTIRGLVSWDGTRFSHAHTQGLSTVSARTMVSFAGKLWVGTDGAGLYVQDAAGGFVPAPGWPGQLQVIVQALWADSGGIVAGNGAGVVLSSGNGVWRGIGDVGLGGDGVNSVLRDRQGALWIRTSSHMWFLPPGATHASDLREGMPPGYDSAGRPSEMAIGPRGDVLIATDAGITYRKNDRWHVIDRSAGMPAAATRSLLVDREGTLWIGAAGLFQLRGRGVIEHHDVTSGLTGDTVWSYQRDRRGALWVGTNRCLARAIAGRWECLPGTEGRVVRGIAFPPQGGVFIGGAPSDLLYVDDSGHARSLGGLEGTAGHHILALALGAEGDLWIATNTGLYRLPGAVPGPLVQVVVPGTQPAGRFASLAVAGRQLWTAAAEGVIVLDGGTWHVFGKAAGFRDSAMSYVVPRADGRMCVTYSEAIGLTCFRYDGGAVHDLEHLGPDDGISTGLVYFLGEDHQRRLWVGTGGGVDVVTPAGIDHFDESDGLAGNDSAATAFMVDPDGSVWLGATGGATHVFAQFYAGPPAAPRTAFLDGRLGDQPIGNTRAGLEVPHDRSALNLTFASSSMLDPKRVEYQVRLSPLESAWSVTHQREARYPALLPGVYRFEVRARVGVGTWGPPAELGFAVLPVWWQAHWFIGIGVVAGLLVIGGGFTWRQRTVLRRRTRQLNERSDASFRAVVDLMPELISVHRHRKLIYLNRVSRRLLGIDAAEHRWADLDLNDWTHPDDRAAMAELFRKVRDLETSVASEVIEVRLLGADGTWRICEVSAILVEIGGARTVVVSGRDVTERKRLRAKLLVSDRMASLGTLAAGIAHEINNPLAYVSGNLEAMAEMLETCARSPTGAEREELTVAVCDARDGAERVRKIVLGLRSFSRSEEEERAPLALADVLEAAIRMTGNEVRHRAQLVRALGPVPLVVADDGRLTQVFINLLVNAAHAIPEGRSDANRITVRTRTDDRGRAVVEVEDTGKGMAPDVQARVFDPFFTTKDVGEGTGLGLSICHGIVSGLGGQITIDSAPGRGTVMRVVLPPAIEVPAAAPAAPSAASTDAGGRRRRRVMLVDDEPLIAQTMARLLRRDYDVTVALCGQDAIAHIAGGARFDAIVSDVMMPNMTGIQLIEELQRMAPAQAERLIFMSGGAFTPQTRDQLDALGAPQLKKPITANELRACVQRVASEAGPIER